VVLIAVSRPFQIQLEGLFDGYEQAFIEDIEEELPFDGGYSPDPHQIIRLPLPAQAQRIVEQIGRGAIGRDRFEMADISLEHIRGLAFKILLELRLYHVG
jgi:hypothetical protein